MAKHGFVYVMTNPYMSVFKIGCTERSPNARASELSAPTGVPDSFQVLCYAEFADCLKAERAMHDLFSGARVNESREFFDGAFLNVAVSILYWTDSRLSFSAPTRFSWAPGHRRADMSFGDVAEHCGFVDPDGPITDPNMWPNYLVESEAKADMNAASILRNHFSKYAR